MNHNESELNLDGEPASPHLLENMDRIFECLDGVLPIEKRGWFEAHLKECPECQSFQRKAGRLEIELERNIKAPALSPEFTASFWQKINSSPELEATCDQQRRKIELEFQKNSARLRKQVFRSSNLLDWLSYAAALAIAAFLLVRLVAEFPAKWLPGLGENWALLASWVAGGAVVICGLACTMSQRWARWLKSI